MIVETIKILCFYLINNDVETLISEDILLTKQCIRGA